MAEYGSAFNIMHAKYLESILVDSKQVETVWSIQNDILNLKRPSSKSELDLNQPTQAIHFSNVYCTEKRPIFNTFQFAMSNVQFGGTFFPVM